VHQLVFRLACSPECHLPHRQCQTRLHRPCEVASGIAAKVASLMSDVASGISDVAHDIRAGEVRLTCPGPARGVLEHCPSDNAATARCGRSASVDRRTEHRVRPSRVRRSGAGQGGPPSRHGASGSAKVSSSSVQ